MRMRDREPSPVQGHRQCDCQGGHPDRLHGKHSRCIKGDSLEARRSAAGPLICEAGWALACTEPSPVNLPRPPSTMPVGIISRTGIIHMLLVEASSQDDQPRLMQRETGRVAVNEF